MKRVRRADLLGDRLIDALVGVRVVETALRRAEHARGDRHERAHVARHLVRDVDDGAADDRNVVLDLGEGHEQRAERPRGSGLGGEPLVRHHAVAPVELAESLGQRRAVRGERVAVRVEHRIEDRQTDRCADAVSSAAKEPSAGEHEFLHGPILQFPVGTGM